MIKKIISASALLFLISIVAIIVFPSLIDNFLKTITGNEFYITQKIYYLVRFGLTPMGLEYIGGDRIAHDFAVLSYYKQHPEELFTGQGMGGLIYVKSISGLQNTEWKTWNHHIEVGYAEVLLRTGIGGLLLYVLLFVSLLRKAFRWRKENIFCALAVAYSLYTVIFSLTNVAFLGQGFGSLYVASLLFTGAYLIDKNMKNNLLFHGQSN